MSGTVASGIRGRLTRFTGEDGMKLESEEPSVIGLSNGSLLGRNVTRLVEVLFPNPVFLFTKTGNLTLVLPSIQKLFHVVRLRLSSHLHRMSAGHSHWIESTLLSPPYCSQNRSPPGSPFVLHRE